MFRKKKLYRRRNVRTRTSLASITSNEIDSEHFNGFRFEFRLFLQEVNTSLNRVEFKGVDLLEVDDRREKFGNNDPVLMVAPTRR